MSTIESMRFICGGCGYRARIPVSYTGKVILCPGCQQMQVASADGGESTGDTVRMSKVATAPGTARFSVPDAEGRLRFTCSGCGYSAKLASTYAGKAISCPQCKSAQVIPPLKGPDDEPGGSAPGSGAGGSGAGKAQPSPAREPATAPVADDGLTFDDQPAPPAAPPAGKPRKPAPADDDGLSFGDEPTARSTGAEDDATRPTVPAVKPGAAATPATKPGTGGVVRRGASRMAMPAAPAVQEHADDEAAKPARPARPLPPWAEKLKQPRMMAILGGCAAALILQIVLITGWSSASGEAEAYRLEAEGLAAEASGLNKQKGEMEFTLSKTTEEVARLRKAESEAKAALAAAETRLSDMAEQLRKSEAEKADEYARRKKAEADQDEMFTKLKAAEKKRDEEYRITTEIRRKYEEEAKLRRDLKARLDEVQAAAK